MLVYSFLQLFVLLFVVVKLLSIYTFSTIEVFGVAGVAVSRSVVGHKLEG